MKIFIDTANLQEIRQAHEWGVIDGVTTNPTLVAKEGQDYKDLIQEIGKIISGPISVEVISTDAPGMIKEALEISQWIPNIAVKIPLIPEGLKATKYLHSKDIDTNVTLAFSANQALLAAKAGATYVSPFVGRIDDIGYDGMQVVRDSVQIFERHQFDTEIIAASIRHPLHVIEAAKAGSHVSTIPLNIIEKMLSNPLTDIGLARFLKDWEKTKQ